MNTAVKSQEGRLKRLGEDKSPKTIVQVHHIDDTKPMMSLDINELSKTEVGVGFFLFHYIKENEKYDIPAFWRLNGLYSVGIVNTLTEHNFYKRKEGDALDGNEANQSIILVKDNNGIIEQVTPEYIKSYLLSLIRTISIELPDAYEDDVMIKVHANELKLKDLFLKRDHLEINEKREISYLKWHSKKLLKDTQEETYLLLKNGIYKITKAGAELLQYNSIDDYCIWKHHISNRTIQYRPYEGEKSQFAKFTRNVSNNEKERLASLITCIGYLVNTYNNPARAKAVMLYDKEETDLDNPEGGTGKGVFVQGIKQLRETAKLDGKNFEKSGQFMWQSVNTTTQVVWIDDPKKGTPFENFHSVITDGFNIEKKNKPQIYIQPEDSPKLVFTSNSVITGEGNTNKRRQYIFEFDSYYKDLQVKGINEPIIHEHGGRFYSDDWDSQEWNLFYSYMIEATICYHQNGLVPAPSVNIERNRLIQSTNKDFVQWADQYEWKCKEPTDDVFKDYQTFTSDEKLSKAYFSRWVKKYGKSKGVEIESIVYEKCKNYIINNPQDL